jgi:CheY-like chemotaxis protein
VDLVLTDLRMADMSGWEVVKAVTDRWPHLPAGVMTGMVEAPLEQRGEALDFVLFKPVTLDAPREALRRVRATGP